MEEDNITDLRKKADQFESQYNKLKKEFKDYIETGRRNEELKKRELQSDFAKKMLVLADSLSRVSVMVNNNSCDIVRNTSENFQKNIDVMYQYLLSSSGLSPVDPLPGDKFDDTRHMAVGLEYGSRYPEDTVFRVVRKGYLRENTLIRPAEVIISKSPGGVTRVEKITLCERLTNWIFPAQRRFTQIDHQIAGLEHTRSEDHRKLHEEIGLVKEFIDQSVAEKQETDERIRSMEESTERLVDGMDEVKRSILQSVSENRKLNEIVRVLIERTERLMDEMDEVKEFIDQSATGKRETDELIRILGEKVRQPARDNPDIVGIIPGQEEMTDTCGPKFIAPEQTVPGSGPEGNEPGGDGPVQGKSVDEEKDTYEGW